MISGIHEVAKSPNHGAKKLDQDRAFSECSDQNQQKLSTGCALSTSDAVQTTRFEHVFHQKPPQTTVLSKHPMLQEQPPPNTSCSKTCLVGANTPRHNRTTSKKECIRVNTTWNSMCYWHQQRRTPSFIQKRIQDMSAREPKNTNNAIIAPECIRSSLVRTNNTKIYKYAR